MRSLDEPSGSLTGRSFGPAAEIRLELVDDDVIATLRRRTATIAERLETLPGFYSSKWQLHRIRAESRQEEARQSGAAGPLNDYLDFEHRRLARSTRSVLSRMRIFFRELHRVAEATPLEPEETQLTAEITASLGELEAYSDDIEFLRHATLAVPEIKAAISELEGVLGRNVGRLG